MKLKFATGLAYFTRNSFLHNLIKFYNWWYLFAIIICFIQMPNVDANNRDELCDWYGQPWLIYSNWRCICGKPWYTWNINICNLDSSRCRSLYWYNSTMQTNWVCGCKTSYTMSNWKCVSSSLYAGQACSKKVWVYSIWFAIWDNIQCRCREWYKFSNGSAIFIDLDSGYNRCIKDNGVINNVEVKKITNNSTATVTKINSTCNKKYPGTIYREEDSMCICANWNEYNNSSKSCENQDQSCNKKYPGTIYRAEDDMCVCKTWFKFDDINKYCVSISMEIKNNNNDELGLSRLLESVSKKIQCGYSDWGYADIWTVSIMNSICTSKGTWECQSWYKYDM